MSDIISVSGIVMTFCNNNDYTLSFIKTQNLYRSSYDSSLQVIMQGKVKESEDVYAKLFLLLLLLTN